MCLQFEFLFESVGECEGAAFVQDGHMEMRETIALKSDCIQLKVHD